MIPKNIFQSWYTKDLNALTEKKINLMKKINPDWSHVIYTDKEIDDFVNIYFAGEIADSYNRLNIIVAKVDFWRYLILYKYGGVYLDMDSSIDKPLNDLINIHDNAIITAERNKNLYVQWGLIFNKEHIILKKTIDFIIDNIKNNAYKNNIHKMTGPTVYSKAIYYVHNKLFNEELIHKNITINTDITYDKDNISYRIYGIDYNEYFSFKHEDHKILYKDKKHWREEQQEKDLIKISETKDTLDVSRPFYCALRFHLEDAYKEANIKLDRWVGDSPEIAIFARNYYNEIQKLDKTKTLDYCFIGSINSCKRRRMWVLDFCKKYFTNNSVYINTDYKPDSNYQLLGKYDYSHKNLGYNPKRDNGGNPYSRAVQFRIISENLFYFQTMCNSKFVLCPAGDSPWSFRFYETLMCNSIPIVESWHHTYRTVSESKFDYQYILYNENVQPNYDESMISKNKEIFEKNHLIPIYEF